MRRVRVLGKGVPVSRQPRSTEAPGDDGHVFCSSTVRRSHFLKCTCCDKRLPMGTSVVFELDARHRFVAVYCDDDTCYGDVWDPADERHPFDLED